MSVCLAEHYSSLSVDDCLGLGQRGQGGLTEDPLVDLPLLRGQGASFALPPGVQVMEKRILLQGFLNLTKSCSHFSKIVPTTADIKSWLYRKR